MKRIAVYLTISHIAFSCGLAASSFWNGTKVKPKTERIHSNIFKQVPAQIPLSPPFVVDSTWPVEAHREVVFGDHGLRIVPHQVRLKSARLRYEIDVSYPEIVGAKDPQIEKLNRHLRKLATEQYQWPMNPSEADLQYYKDKHPEAFNTIDLDYEIRLAMDPLVSIYFIGYSYGIGAAHSLPNSFTVNYDLSLHKELKLSDVFKPNSRYLEFIARHCREELSRQVFMFSDALASGAENFESWNITPFGIAFNFDACKLTGCAGGKLAVEIPFPTLKPWLNSNILPPTTE